MKRFQPTVNAVEIVLNACCVLLRVFFRRPSHDQVFTRVICFVFCFSFSSGRVDHFSRSMAPVDIPVADHRRSPDRAGNTVLHTVHTDQSVHYLRHGHCRVLRAGDGHVFSVLSYIQRDEKETKRLAKSASHEQTTQVRHIYICICVYTIGFFIY